MKFKDERPFASVDAAVKKLLEIANRLEADPAGRLQIGVINEQFLKAGASVAEYKAALRAAVERGLIALHPSGAYMTFTRPARTFSRKDHGAKRPPTWDRNSLQSK
jgi:hypothetical protein